eukprot:CAMPEP_0115147962 /NCGR_PEP_ID=MMETSP0227-20121206/63605_1 /TAXON_ID=89957 /ORGANISM="Polarella glacialis, Strain CCMP 1383" /LENGTH=570 /DNA_ID=CAMNT_0002557935 /DNA_START=83 /DNA_END=1796 /DNA_ORIENTATION=-
MARTLLFALLPLLAVAKTAPDSYTCNAVVDNGAQEVQCTAGVPDCASCKVTPRGTCAEPSGMREPEGSLAVLIVAAIVGCVMCFGIGGNDAANSWVRRQRRDLVFWACILGGIGEFLGATLLGAGVSNTIQTAVAEIHSPGCWACGFCDSKMAMYQFGMLAALISASVFLFLTTFWALPVSTTHAIVGGVVGMTAVCLGGGCLNWAISGGLGAIVLSWVLSPLLAGFVAMAMYLFNYMAVFNRRDPVEAAFVVVPFLYGFTAALILFLILLKSPITKKAVSPQARYISTAMVFFVVTLLVKFFLNPRTRRDLEAMRKEAQEEKQKKAEAKEEPAAAGENCGDPEVTNSSQMQGVQDLPKPEERQLDADDLWIEATEEELEGKAPTGLRLCQANEGTETPAQLEAKRVFKPLLIMVAFLESFAHGANDTANATGPVGAIWATYDQGIYACSVKETPVWIMAIAGLFVALGVNVMGYRVIKTMGKDLCCMDFHLGFCIEFASGFSVVMATLIGMPVSTTHCQVGAVVFVGSLAHGPRNVSWGMMGKIVIAWVSTLPFAGGLGALLMHLRFFV